MILVGKVAIFAALLLAAGAAGLAFYGARDKRREELSVNAYWLTVVVFMALSIAALILLTAFITKNYTFAYVAGNSDSSMTLFFRIAAFWAGQEGSLLLWAWLIAGASAIIAWRKVEDGDPLVTNALGVLNIIALFFLVVLVTPGGDPFKAAAPGAAVGQGINPLLLHWAMVLHPPTLFVGYAFLAIPFAFALGALITGDTSKHWLKLSDRWAVGAWLFLSIGIFLGALWAYVVLGWGGFWGWDPVENSSFLPWLTGTAMLHSFTMWKRRNGFKFWAVSLAAVTFFLTLLATFITRSGIISSAHTFEGDPYFFWVFGVFMALVVVASVALMWIRRAELHSPTIGGGEEGETTFFNREFVYYLNNVFLCAAAAIIAWGTLAPAITQFLGLQQITYKAEFYNGIAAPLTIFYMAALGICPLLSMKKTDPGRFWRLVMWPAIIAAVAAVPIVMRFGQAKASSSVGWVGVLGMIMAVFVAASAVQLYVRGAMQRSQQKGVGPFSALGQLFVKNRSQTGGYMVHFGVALMVIGIIGTMMFGLEDLVAIGAKKGSTGAAPTTGIGLTVVGLDARKFPRRDPAPSTYVLSQEALSLKLSENGKPAGTITPVLKGFQNNVDRAAAEGDPKSGYNPQVDIKPELFRDVFVIYQGHNDDGSLALQVKVNPLISWVWVGALILILGTTWAMWPARREPEMASAPARRKTAAARARA